MFTHLLGKKKKKATTINTCHKNIAHFLCSWMKTCLEFEGQLHLYTAAPQWALPRLWLKHSRCEILWEVTMKMLNKNHWTPLPPYTDVRLLRLHKAAPATPKTGLLFQPAQETAWLLTPIPLPQKTERMIPEHTYQQVAAVRRKISSSLIPRWISLSCACLFGLCSEIRSEV